MRTITLYTTLAAIALLILFVLLKSATARDYIAPRQDCWARFVDDAGTVEITCPPLVPVPEHMRPCPSTNGAGRCWTTAWPPRSMP